MVRDRISTERTCRANGFGYRRKNARRGVGGGSGLWVMISLEGCVGEGETHYSCVFL